MRASEAIQSHDRAGAAQFTLSKALCDLGDYLSEFYWDQVRDFRIVA